MLYSLLGQIYNVFNESGNTNKRGDNMNTLYSLILNIALATGSNGEVQVHEYVVDYNLSKEDCAYYIEQHANKSLSCVAQVK